MGRTCNAQPHVAIGFDFEWLTVESKIKLAEIEATPYMMNLIHIIRRPGVNADACTPTQSRRNMSPPPAVKNNTCRFIYRALKVQQFPLSLDRIWFRIVALHASLQWLAQALLATAGQASAKSRLWLLLFVMPYDDM